MERGFYHIPKNRTKPEEIPSHSISSSFAETSSYALEASHSVYADNATNAGAASFAISSSFASTSSFYRETDPVFNRLSSSFATTGSNTFKSNQIISGSTRITGSLVVTGSITGSSFTGSFTGSLLGTSASSSFYQETDPVFNRLSSSFATTGSNTFRGVETISGSANITGSLIITGSTTGSSFTGSFTGSLLGTSSFATTASYSLRTKAVGNDNQIVYNLNGLLTSSNQATIDANGTLTIQPSSSQTYVINSFDGHGVGVYLGGGNISSDSGLYDEGGDNILAAFDSSASRFYLNGAYIFTDFSNTTIYSNRVFTFIDSVILSGISVTGSGQYSFARGNINHASGNFSTAFGTGSISYGDYSLVSGEGLIASGSSQTIFGRYNKRNNTSDAFVIGGGTSDSNRRDILNVSLTNFIVSSSIITLSGSNLIFTGSVSSLGGITAPSFTGSLLGTSSWAFNSVTSSFYQETDPIFNRFSSSFATTGSNTFKLNQIISGSVNITGSLIITGSVTGSSFTGSFTGSLLGTSTSASFAQTAQSANTVLNGNSGGSGIAMYPAMLFQNGASSTVLRDTSWSFDATTAANRKLVLTGSITASILITAPVIAATSFTGSSYTGSFTGSFLGSVASSSFASTASYIAAGGLNTHVQYNYSGSLTGSRVLTFDGNTLLISGSALSSPQRMIVSLDGYGPGTVLGGGAFTSESGLYDYSNQGIIATSFGNGNYWYADGVLILRDGAAGSYATLLSSFNLGLTVTSSNAGNGITSMAEGFYTYASGNYSHAAGSGSVSKGLYSHAGGEQTIASGTFQTVFGRFNAQNNANDIFVIGGGTSNANRKDILNISTASVSISSSLISISSSIINITGSTRYLNDVSASSFTGSFTGSLQGTSSFSLTASFYQEIGTVFNRLSSSFATTGSNTFRGNQIISGSVTITGSTTITGSLIVTGFVTGSSFTGSFTGSLISTGSLTGSFTGSASGSFTGSLRLFQNWSQYISAFTDCDGMFATASGTWIVTGSSNPTVSNNLSIDNTGSYPGIVGIRTSVTTTGTTFLTNYNTGSLSLGKGETVFETLFQFPALSTAAQNFFLRAGYWSDIVPGHGVGFEYNQSGNAGRWKFLAYTGGVSGSNIDTGVSASINTWTKMKIVVNAAGTTASGYLNNTFVGNVFTQVPTGSNNVSPMVGLQKTAGNAVQSVYVDYIGYEYVLTTAR
jgi:hypothetical protein